VEAFPAPAIDCWVNVDIAGQGGGRPEFLERVRTDYFKRDADDFIRVTDSTS